MSKKLVVVLGMHRSGTSAITRALRVLGVELGKTLMAQNNDNPKGFFEDREINQLDIEIMNSLGQDWHDLSLISDESFGRMIESDFAERAKELLVSKLENCEIFGLKDPRMCKLMPFWQPIFDELGLETSYVISLRNPKSICDSLANRDGIEAEKSYYMWLIHTLDALKYTHGRKSCFVEFDSLMTDPKANLERCAKELELDFDNDEFDTYVNSFLDDNLRHSVYSSLDLLEDPACDRLVYEVYTFLHEAINSNPSLIDNELIEVLQQWYRRLSIFTTVFSLVDKISSINSSVATTAHQAQVERMQILIEQSLSNLQFLNKDNDELKYQVKELTKQLAVTKTQNSKLEAEINSLRENSE